MFCVKKPVQRLLAAIVVMATMPNAYAAPTEAELGATAEREFAILGNEQLCSALIKLINDDVTKPYTMIEVKRRHLVRIEYQDAIDTHKVVIGMTLCEVQLAWGKYKATFAPLVAQGHRFSTYAWGTPMGLGPGTDTLLFEDNILYEIKSK